MTTSDGLIWHSTPRATVGLVVSGGVVVDAPPYARGWALGRPAPELLGDPHAQTAWIPNVDPDEKALEIFLQGLPDARVISTIAHERSTMTTTAPEQTSYEAQSGGTEDWSNGETAPRVSYPEVSDNPHNHTYTWSPKLPDGSMLVIRSQTAEGLVQATEALNGALVARLRTAWQGVVGAPQAPQQAPQGPLAPFQAQAQQQFNQQPAQPYPQQGGQAPAAWQNAGAPQGPQLPPGWYKLNVPFPQKGTFDAIVAQNGVRKGDPGGGGQVSFQRASKSWYCSPEVAQLFSQFQPVPA